MVRTGLFLGGIGCGIFAVCLAGCGGDSGASHVTLAKAGGEVTFRGGPLGGASVTFIPESGPIATATTDLSGKFQLTTAGQAGAPVGKCKVIVSAYEGGAAPGSEATEIQLKPPANDAEREEYMQKMTQMQKPQSAGGGPPGAGAKAPPKSLVPIRYTKPETSNLSFEVQKDSSKNEFVIKLEE